MRSYQNAFREFREVTDAKSLGAGKVCVDDIPVLW